MGHDKHEQPQGNHGAAKEGESDTIRNHKALRNQSSVDPEDYPDKKARSLHTPKK